MPATYENIATTTLTSAQTSVTFSNISSAYTDIVLVSSYLGTLATAELWFQLNSDTGSNYSWTQLYGNGSSAASYRGSNQSQLRLFPNEASRTTTPTVSITHFMNYSNTTTNKAMLHRSNNADLSVASHVSLWRSTSAINTIYIYTATSSIAAGSTFTLYGIKAA